ncbi:U-box domain-containing protein 21 [Cardamine amara subsp. amara]|uniref:U-box domain-containing protein n=1 Tax=Cardamine amara subsp. amara TaxID=228776 RepID=A0ABD1C6H0_CARAN
MGFNFMSGMRVNEKNITPVTSWSESESEIIIPPEFQCPISIDLMTDPVIISTGITYDRVSIEKWINSGNKTCPVTNTVLTTFDQIPNHAIRKMIQGWCVEKGSSLIKRIPTPRVPLMPCEVYEICRKLSSATRRGDYKKCVEIIGKIKKLGEESERNQKCINENGVGLVLCDCFVKFSGDKKLTAMLNEILSLLTWMVPIGSEGITKLASESSFRCVSGLLRSKEDSVRQNAAFFMKEILTLDETRVHAFAVENGVVEAFAKLIRDSVSSTATKFSLIAIYQMVLQKPEIASEFLDVGLVNLTVEMIVNAENSVCEKALAVLDAICETKKGREEVRKNALVMPLLVKKILKVSELATRSSVSVILKLSKTENVFAVEEAVCLGAFQKVFLVLQVGYGEETKAKATELLKMMNAHMKLMGDCVDSSMNFKYLKKPKSKSGRLRNFLL